MTSILHSRVAQSLVWLRQRTPVEPAAAGQLDAALHRREPARPDGRRHQGAEVPALLQRRGDRRHHGKTADESRGA